MYLRTLCITLMLTGLQRYAIAQDSNRSALKNKALTILHHKCNTCHTMYNRKIVFTESTMETYANNIYKQVYIKRRMPKGRKVTLTKEEEANLLLWLKEKGVARK